MNWKLKLRSSAKSTVSWKPINRQLGRWWCKIVADKYLFQQKNTCTRKEIAEPFVKQQLLIVLSKIIYFSIADFRPDLQANLKGVSEVSSHSFLKYHCQTERFISFQTNAALWHTLHKFKIKSSEVENTVHITIPCHDALYKDMCKADWCFAMFFWKAI